VEDPFLPVAEAFTRKAQVYDEFGRDHPNLDRMRRKVRQHMLAHLEPGDRVLELNAGTGADAAFLAMNGFVVHATDLSPGMTAQIQSKIDSYRLHSLMTVQQCSFTRLDEITNGPFQAVLSNLGGLNCVPDLSLVAAGLAPLLTQGAVVVWVIMPPVCLWEIGLVLRGQIKHATRRWSSGGVMANVEGVQIRSYYYSPGNAIQAFGNDFKLESLRGLSVFTPPADHKGFPRRYPGLYRWLCLLEDRFADRNPWRAWGDFYILTMRYQPS
jgi:ubiquinone/menaquinone biosynthesis C-methylase UbiE